MIFHTPPRWLTRDVHIAVIGAGGTGSVALSMLAQMNHLLQSISNRVTGISVTAFDGDTVSEFNVGRQNFWPMDQGKFKAQTLIERLNIGFGSQWQFNNRYATAKESFQHYDIVITCVDSVRFRLELGAHYRHIDTDTLWIDGGNDNSSGQVIVGHLGLAKETPTLPNWYDLYGSSMRDATDNEADSCSHEDALNKQDFGVNHQCALLLVQHVWQMLRHGHTSLSGQYFDLKEGDVLPLKLDPVSWASFGYQQ